MHQLHVLESRSNVTFTFRPTRTKRGPYKRYLDNPKDRKPEITVRYHREKRRKLLREAEASAQVNTSDHACHEYNEWDDVEEESNPGGTGHNKSGNIFGIHLEDSDLVPIYEGRLVTYLYLCITVY